MIVHPGVSKHKVTLNSDRTSLQIATSGGIKVISVIVSAGGAAAAVRVYDSTDGINQPSPSLDSFLVRANAGESTPYCPSQPVSMDKGLYVELEEGAAFNGEAFITYS